MKLLPFRGYIRSRLGAGQGGGSSVPSAPTGLVATPGIVSIALSWSASSGATSYKIYRGTSSGTETLLASGNVPTSYTDSSVNGTAIVYYYKVSAVNAAGESALSSEVSGTPGPANATGPLLFLEGTLSSLFQDSGGTTPATANNDPVGDWTDFSGLANNETQPTNGNRPKLTTNALNSLKGITFTGLTPTWLTAAAALLDRTKQYTAYFVATVTSSEDGTVFANTDNSGTSGDFLRFRDNAGTQQIRVFASGGGGTVLDGTTGIASNSYGYYTVTNAAVSGTPGTAVIRANGTQVATGAMTRATAAADTNLRVGVINTSVAPLDGTLVALLLYQGALVHDATTITNVESWLKTRYGL